MLRGTIRKDDFQRNTALQCWNNVATIRNNVATMLQRCVVLKIVVTNRLVQHHLQRQNCKSFTTPLSRNAHMRLEHKESQTKYRNTTRKPRSHISNVGVFSLSSTYCLSSRQPVHFSRAPAFTTRRTIYDEMEGLHVLDRALRLD